MTLRFPFENTYADLPDRFYARQAPVPVAAPRLIRLNRPLAQELGLSADALETSEGVAVLAGNAVPEDARPLAQAYAGHQFGGWVPQLGDGRAILLGEVVDIHGARRDIQLKGAGRTPFSRMGDGRAWLGPVLREYLVSEAMHAMQVPTTRALAAVATGETVLREAPYPGAILTRVAASHVRVGTFQYFAAREDVDALRRLVEFVIDRHYPQAGTPMNLLNQVIDRQARLVAQWMGVGFIHGVMNTDNTTISGETIDYGPCAFMDAYQAEQVYSSIDHFGRYAFNRQPDILVWNLAQFATALLPLMGADQDAAISEATEVVNGFLDRFRDAWMQVFGAKIGLVRPLPGDANLIYRLLDLMEANRADFTLTFRGLANGRADALFLDAEGFRDWRRDWLARLAEDGSNDDDAAERMARVNPAIIPRNHQVEAVIRASLSDDFGPFDRLLGALGDPYADPEDAPDLLIPPKPEEVVAQTFCGT
ncbi:MAG: YdiU family protein [Pseudomonadota bacterium]